MNVYIITSAKFEECYIEEWVKYHLSIGIDKIIINDNNPKDYPYKLQDILKKYIDNNQVIIERYYDHFNKNVFDEQNMYKIYTWLYKKYKDEFDWVCKFDIDEFLEIPETNNDIKKFLAQDKFDNALSIIIPFVVYGVKDGYINKFTRLKNNRDRYKKLNYKHIECTTGSFKSIIKKTDIPITISLHYAYFKTKDPNLIHYVFPNGNNMISNILMNHKDHLADILFKHNKKYFCEELSSICHLNHYSYGSIEEQVNHAIKFEADKYKTWCLHKFYIQLYNKYKDMFEHPRDLYKIYFIDNINNIE